jgi:protein-L-isoaspartate(D-aspartate) O-methyltransferase
MVMQDSQEKEHWIDGRSDRWASAREHMLRFDLRGRDITDRKVLQVMAQVPRERFVPSEYEAQAYEDRPLPIGLNQTISQPYIVALMTQALAVTEDCEVLEIGTGSGYQTAVLARLAKKVYTVERLETLSGFAQRVLGQLGVDNVEFHIGDGTLGWPAPRTFERIMVTAAVQEVPRPLLDQLKVDGLLIAPVGSATVQTLVLFRRTQTGTVQRDLCAVRFVRLIGEHGFDD